MELELDHLVVAARTLEEGVSHVAALLGISPDAFSPKIKSTSFGTVNRCLALEPDCYLEVIAIDPSAASPPSSPRWLDDTAIQERLAAGGPQLLTWVVRLKAGSDCDLAELAQQQPQLGLPPLAAVERGEFKWQIGIPADGRRLPGDGSGLIPRLIQWDSATPAQRLPPSGLRLQRLTARHSAASSINQQLEALGAAELMKVSDAPSAAVPSMTAAVWRSSGHTVKMLW